MDYEFLIILLSVLFLASFVHGTVGFGFPMIATPLIAIFTDMQTAIIYTLIPTLLVNIMSIKSEGHFFEAVKRFYPLALLTMAGSAVGTTLLIHYNSDFFKLILAFTILIYLFFDFVKIEFPWIVNNPKTSRFIFGFGSGILGGLTNVMSATLIIYVLESKFTKKEIVQSFNICFLFGKIVQIIIFTSSASITIKQFNESSLGLIAIFIAITLGLKIKNRIDIELYKKIVKGILLIISLFLFVQFI